MKRPAPEDDINTPAHTAQKSLLVKLPLKKPKIDDFTTPTRPVENSLVVKLQLKKPKTGRSTTPAYKVDKSLAVKLQLKKPKADDGSSSSVSRAEDLSILIPVVFTLLDLPRELRDMIYGLVIGGYEACATVVDIDIDKFVMKASPYNEDNETMAQWDELFNLSYVCRQLNEETRDLPYQLSAFYTPLSGLFSLFLRQVKEEKKRLITALSFGFREHHSMSSMDYEEFTVPHELFDCTGIKTVISRITLSAVQKKMVKEYAASIGAELVHENKHLGYVDDNEDGQMERLAALEEGYSYSDETYADYW